MLSQQILTVEDVDNNNCQTLFIAADSQDETQRISGSSHDWCTVVNKLVQSKYVYNSKRRLRLHRSMLCQREQSCQNLFVCIGKSEAKVTNNKRLIMHCWSQLYIVTWSLCDRRASFVMKKILSVGHSYLMQTQSDSAEGFIPLCTADYIPHTWSTAGTRTIGCLFVEGIERQHHFIWRLKWT